ncbi:MAG: response regulator [Actinomycetota bacterium]|nr:response regulator [Actinomycetota bacterium]
MGSNSPRIQPIRVLLCDDTPDILVLLGAEFGLHDDLEIVAEATNGMEAVALAEQHQPDVVVLDLAMPKMDGLEALGRILEVSPRSRVVVLSAIEAETIACKVISMGARDYVEKGVSADDIAAAVRRAAAS